MIGRHVDDAPVILARGLAVAELVRLGGDGEIDALLHRRVEDVGAELAVERDQLGPRRRRRQPLDAVEQRRQLRLADANARRARERLEGRVGVAGALLELRDLRQAHDALARIGRVLRPQLGELDLLVAAPIEVW